MSSREPLHSVIASRAEARIRSGAWTAGTRLPPERDLCEQLEVSRSTLRQALAELEARGLISRHQGRGTFVTRPRVDAAVTGHFTISAALRARGMTLVTRVLSVRLAEATRQVAQDLGLSPGDPVVRLERMRLLADEPLLIETAQLPATLFPGLPAADFEHRSLYDILGEDHGRLVQSATESLEPVILTVHEAALLGVPRPAAALLVRRIATDQTGTLVELSDLLLRGDRSRFLLERRVRDPWAGAPPPDAARPTTTRGGAAPVPAHTTAIAAGLLEDRP